MQYAASQLRDAGMIVFGRATYELMAAHWPTPAAAEADPEVAELMNTLPTLVFSSTLERFANTGRRGLVRRVIEGCSSGGASTVP